MSIREDIRRLIKDEVIFPLEHSLWGPDTVREVFVSERFLREVSVSLESKGSEPGAIIRAFLDYFLQGAKMTVSEEPFHKDKFTDIARTHPPEGEVWDMRILEPDAGIRVLGRFAYFDAFVPLVWDYRENIEGEEEWFAFIESAKAEWRKIFGNCLPFHGKKIDEYLSEFKIG